MIDYTKKRIGIIGGGQLGKMMILEAKRLGFYVVTLDPTPDCPSHGISDEHIIAEFDDQAAYFELAQKVDVITYEFEHINAETLDLLEKENHTIYPSVTALKTIKNKFLQKHELADNAIPVPIFMELHETSHIFKFAEMCALPYPLMLKTTTGGYDGKGNTLIENEADVFDAVTRLGGIKQGLMLEKFIPFKKEISVIACRGIDGKRVIYPVAENHHVNSILDITVVPARISKTALDNAALIADKVMQVFEGVGTFCIEMFVTEDDRVLVNEIAPRPHNSGHYTIEGCFANQFENHIRAIIGLPFGNVDLISPTVMVNLLGESDGVAQLVGLEEAYRDPNIHIHLYGKSESKTSRKMGHFTIVDEDLEVALEKAMKIKSMVKVVGGARGF